jgi:hypothetical protein
MLNMIGSIVYLAVAALCIRASMAADRKGKGQGDRRVWLCAAVFFCIFALMRALALEDALRDILRAALIRDDAYAARRGFQFVPAASLIQAVSAGGFLTWRSMHKRR